MSGFLRTSSILVISTCTVLTACAQELGDTANPTISAPTSSSSSSQDVSSSSVSSAKGERPSEIIIPVPFASQAPLANWDELHQEACEEMSLIMVDHALKGTKLTPQIAEEEVQALVAWETKQGYKVDVTAEQVRDIARVYFDMPGHLDTDITEEHMVDLLSDGHLIIIPAAGRTLGNPYFSGEGPWYHMLVIRGWKKGVFSNVFITNDPGTRRGEAYEYDVDVIINAIHDWVGVGEKIETGPKVMFVVDERAF